ncbi:MAG: DUF6580 family putative transport protein [Patescibacteria group bacterium]
MKRWSSKLSQENKYVFLLAIVLIAFAIVARLLPHPANFTPVGAAIIFAALYLPRRWALVIPFSILIVSDLMIGFYSWPIMLCVYGSFLIMALLGFWIRKRKNVLTVISGTLIGSILFFLITNAAVWLFGTMYVHDLSGLMTSYMNAVPFFRNTIAGDLFYVAILVGVMELVQSGISIRQRARVEITA